MDETIQHPPGVCLVLGATGFIGRAVCRELVARKHGVIGVARREPKQANGFSTIALDICDSAGLRRLLREVRPAFIINATGHAADEETATFFDFYEKTTISLLNAAMADAPSVHVVLLGSAAEYGPCDEGKADETYPLQPVAPYGRAKVRQYDLAQEYARKGLSVLTARLFNPIGPGQDQRHFVGMLMRRIRNGNLSPDVYHANWIRDWIDVRDVASAIAVMAEGRSPAATVNVCTGNGQAVGAVSDLIASFTGAEVKKHHGPTSIGELWRSVGNPSRLLSTGWRPRCSLTDSLKDQWRELS